MTMNAARDEKVSEYLFRIRKKPSGTLCKIELAKLRKYIVHL